jgi:ATP-dependent Clp protease ATP-binding subunit ClpX
MRIRKLRCSFCRKTEDQISKLVAGPRLIVGPKLYICNECVAVANSIMQGNPPPTPAVSRSLLQKAKECWRHLIQSCVAREASAV